MRFTRRQLLQLAAAQGVLLSLPRAATAAIRLSPGDGFVGAARWGDHLAVASNHLGTSQIVFSSASSGQTSAPTVAVPAPLVVGAIAVVDDVLHVGGHLLKEGPAAFREAGDPSEVFADSGDPTDLVDDLPEGRVEIHAYDLVPWTATMTSPDGTLGDPVFLEDRRGVVCGFTPNTGDPVVWIAECPEAATFSATAVRAFRGVDGPEIPELSLATSEADVSSVLTVSDGQDALIASNDHGLARVWAVSGETITELRLPGEATPRAVLQLMVVDSTYNVITADLEDGTVRRWKRSGLRWARSADDERNLVTVGGIHLEMPNR
jgi:hypothetical protein